MRQPAPPYHQAQRQQAQAQQLEPRQPVPTGAAPAANGPAAAASPSASTLRMLRQLQGSRPKEQAEYEAIRARALQAAAKAEEMNSTRTDAALAALRSTG